jgi:hypothetical protein
VNFLDDDESEEFADAPESKDDSDFENNSMGDEMTQS